MNVVIKHAFLGFEEDNFIFYLVAETDQGIVRVGNMRLDATDTEGNVVAHPVAGDVITSLLKVLGVNSWDELSETPAVIEVDDNQIVSIGNFLDATKVLNFADLIAKYEENNLDKEVVDEV